MQENRGPYTGFKGPVPPPEPSRDGAAAQSTDEMKKEAAAGEGQPPRITQRPSIGRIVHVMPITGGNVLPAIITRVHSDTMQSTSVDVTVFGYGVPYAMSGVKYVDHNRPDLPVGHWTWPPRV